MSELLVDRDGSITVFTLNRPEHMNALSRGLREQLKAALTEFEADPDQRVAIFTGAGERAFSAGADLKEMAGAAERRPIAAAPDIDGIARCEKITIAAVNGLAVAGGMELALCCDIRIAVDTAWFGLFEVSRGMIAGVAANLLPRLVPFGTAMDLMLTGERLPAAEALRIGLIQQVVPADELMNAARTKAAAIAAKSPTAVWGTKKVLTFWRDALVTEQHRFYEAVAERVSLSGDYLEGARAFAEKREPRFATGWPRPVSPPVG